MKVFSEVELELLAQVFGGAKRVASGGSFAGNNELIVKLLTELSKALAELNTRSNDDFSLIMPMMMMMMEHKPASAPAPAAAPEPAKKETPKT